MRFMVVGHGRHGKDESMAILEKLTGLTNAGTSSQYLLKHVQKLRQPHLTSEECYNSRHENRQIWYDLGRELRSADPGFLVRECYENGDIAGGYRELCEIEAAIVEGMIGKIIWVERDWEQDPTMDFTLSDVARAVAKANTPHVTLDVIFNMKDHTGSWWRWNLERQLKLVLAKYQIDLQLS